MDIDKIIAEVERLDREATPGPWIHDDSADSWRLHGSGLAVGCVQILKAPKHSTPFAEYWPSAADAALIATFRAAAPLLAAEVRRLRADVQQRIAHGNALYDAIVRRLAPHFPSGSRDLDWDVLPGTLAALVRERDEARSAEDQAIRSANAASAAMLAAEQERDMLRADLEAAAGEVLVPIPEPGTVAAKMLLANRLLKSEIHRLKGTMIEPTEQTGDEDSEHGAPVCVLCGRDIDVSAPFSTGPASGPAGRILGDDESAHGECLDHARQAVA